MHLKLIVCLVLSAALLACGTNQSNQTTRSRPVAQNTPAAAPSQQAAEHAHSPEMAHGAPQARIPAHYKNAASVGNLPPILAPEQFSGKVRLAYQAAREIPATLAQLPCFCYCDQSVGHKSLHSCFEDTHGAHCGTCLDEALLAYRLQKEQRMTPELIRQTIIENYQGH